MNPCPSDRRRRVPWVECFISQKEASGFPVGSITWRWSMSRPLHSSNIAPRRHGFRLHPCFATANHRSHCTSRKHPALSRRSRTLASCPALFSNHVHLVTSLDVAIVGCQCCDGLGLLDKRTRDEFSFGQSARMLKQLVLKAVVNVFLDDDEFPIGLSKIESVG